MQKTKNSIVRLSLKQRSIVTTAEVGQKHYLAYHLSVTTKKTFFSAAPDCDRHLPTANHESKV